MSHGINIVCVHKRVAAAGIVERLARARWFKRDAADMLAKIQREAIALLAAHCEHERK